MIQRCEAVLASGRICGNIFAADSIFCRKCGTPRPSQPTKGEDTVDEELEEGDVPTPVGEREFEWFLDDPNYTDKFGNKVYQDAYFLKVI